MLEAADDVENTQTDDAPVELVEPRQRELSGKLAGLSLSQQVLTLAIWPFLEQLLNFLVGFVDMGLAGRLSGDVTVLAAVDAIAIAAFIGWFSGLMFLRRSAPALQRSSPGPSGLVTRRWPMLDWGRRFCLD